MKKAISHARNILPIRFFFPEETPIPSPVQRDTCKSEFSKLKAEVDLIKNYFDKFNAEIEALKIIIKYQFCLLKTLIVNKLYACQLIIKSNRTSLTAKPKFNIRKCFKKKKIIKTLVVIILLIIQIQK